MQANPWEIDWSKQQPATGAPAMTPITGADPTKAVEAERGQLGLKIDQLQLTGQELTNRAKQQDIDAAAAKAAKDQQQVKDLDLAKSDILNVIDAARRAKKMSAEGWFTTGIGSEWIGSNTTSGKDIRGLIDTIGSNVAFDRLQKMRAESPTGGALGSITEKELQLLQSTVASLDPGQSDEQFQRNMDTIIERYAGILQKIGGEVPAELPENPAGEDVDALEFSVSDDRRPGETEEQYRQRIGRGEEDAPVVPQRGGGGTLEAIDAAVRGVADTLTFGAADRIAAFGDTLLGGTLENNLRAQRQVDEYDERNNPGTRLTGQIGGGLIFPSRFLASTPGRLAAQGAAGGGLYGYNSSDQGWSSSDALLDAGLGATTGGAAAGTFGLIGAHVRPRGNTPAIDLYEAAQRQRVQVMPADVGGTTVQRLTAGAAQTPFGSGPVIRGAERANDQTGARLLEIAQAEGTPARQEVFGEVAQRGAKRYIAGSQAEGRALYGAARAEAGTATASAPRAVAKIDEHLTELGTTSNTSAPEITALKKLRADLASQRGANLKQLPIDAIRNLRTSVRAMAQNDELRGSDFQRRAGQVLSELREDISASLTPEARAAFREADRKWQIRLQTIDDVMEQVIGPKGERSAERVAGRLLEMSRTDSSRLRRFIEAIPEEEKGIVRGSLIQEIGRANSGAQDAAGGKFSLSTFLTNWDKLPERTRNTLFRGESRAAIEDLAKVAEGAKASARFSNTSNTAGALTAASIVTKAASGTAAWNTLGASFALEKLSGHLLASPTFTRALIWAARARRDPGAIARRFSRVAIRQPHLAPEIEAFLGEDGATETDAR